MEHKSIYWLNDVMLKSPEGGGFEMLRGKKNQLQIII